MKYTPIIGAEIHVQLKTKSGMFCGCINDTFGADAPNTHTCPVCLGLPGALPIANKQAIDWTIMVGLALHCQIAKVSKFDRKHYFYPDLPKAYQISQYDEPLCTGGYVDTSFGRVRIRRIHLEEDTAKLVHEVVDGVKVSLIDFNRSGTPLMEIVTEPDLHSAEESKEFLKKIRDIVRALGVSDCDMEKGSVRLEANISLSRDGSLPNYKVEVKNINSFRFFGLSVDAEIARHSEILDQGAVPKQETRGWREKDGTTVPQRSKEEAKDYRYFPEPDIPPLVISDEWVESLRSQLPPLPDESISKLVEQGISSAAAKVLINNSDMLKFVEQVKKINEKHVIFTANAIVNKKFDHTQVSPEEYIKSLESAGSNKITDVKTLTALATTAIQSNPDAVESYKSGKSGASGVMMGSIMKESHGRADAQLTNKILRELLEKV